MRQIDSNIQFALHLIFCHRLFRSFSSSLYFMSKQCHFSTHKDFFSAHTSSLATRAGSLATHAGSRSDNQIKNEEFFHVYSGWLDSKEEVQMFEKEAKKLIKIMKAKDQLNFQNTIQLLVSAEEAIQKRNDHYRSRTNYIDKWQFRKQLRNAIIQNLKYQNEIDKSQRLLEMIRLFLQIQNAQYTIAKGIIEYIMSLPDIPSIYRPDYVQKNFFQQQSHAIDILEVINKKYQQIQKNQFNLQLTKDTKCYILDEFYCLFDIKAKKNYAQKHLSSYSPRYGEAIIKDQIVFNISPLTVTIFKSIFECPYKLYSVSGTSRIGKSIALLLARILSSYMNVKGDWYVFFQNFNQFQRINSANRYIIRMIRNSLWDTLQKKDFYILNYKNNDEVNKKIAQNAQNSQNQNMIYVYENNNIVYFLTRPKFSILRLFKRE